MLHERATSLLCEVPRFRVDHEKVTMVIFAFASPGV
jgi:hypothetical protein